MITRKALGFPCRSLGQRKEPTGFVFSACPHVSAFFHDRGFLCNLILWPFNVIYTETPGFLLQYMKT